MTIIYIVMFTRDMCERAETRKIYSYQSPLAAGQNSGQDRRPKDLKELNSNRSSADISIATSGIPFYSLKDAEEYAFKYSKEYDAKFWIMEETIR